MSSDASFGELLQRVSRALAERTRTGHTSSGVPYQEPAVQDEGKDREALLLELREVRARLSELEGQRLSSSERLFGGLLEAAPDGIIISDDQGIIRLVNPRAEKLLGYEPGELIGEGIEILVPEALRAAHEQHRKRYAQNPTARRMGIGLELAARRKDGTEIPTEISLSPLQTEAGRYIVSAIRDVTERRETEALLRKQAEELQRSNDQLQQFAYVASHDLQEPLRMVSSYLQLLERRYGDKLDDSGLEFLGFAVDGAKRMQDLIQDLLAYSRVGTRAEPHVPVNLRQVVDQTLADHQLVIEESGAEVQVGVLPTVFAEPSQMQQLFSNLVSNALKFRKPGVAPQIQIDAEWKDGAWDISVADNGIGIDRSYADRIFQIFQRLHTRQEYPGTGIGLAICKRIVERHDGGIHLTSEPGHGTCFTVVLPDRSEP